MTQTIEEVGLTMGVLDLDNDEWDAMPESVQNKLVKHVTHKPKKYEVQVGCTYVIEVEADSVQQAQEQAIEEARSCKPTWEVEAIRETK